jgi:predicted transposase YbfD/YdcC
LEGLLEGFISIFSTVEDPRAENTRHNLLEILFIGLAAVLCGAESCSDMADFGEAKEDLLRQVLGLEHGIPSHDTFSRVFRLLDPEQFEAAFRRFTAAFAQKGRLSGVVALDGKAVRGAFERGARTTPLHLVNVWAADQRLALAQRKAPKRNEVAGALEVLQLLSLKGCTVTADALHCHREMARAIRDRGGEYVLALKENQSAIFADVVRSIDTAVTRDESVEDLAKSHGRLESRRAIVVRDKKLAEAHDFPGIRAIGRIEAVRRVDGKADEIIARHFLLSKPLTAAKFLEVVRTHWSIENQLHWVLDVIFDEDRARNRKDNGPENLAILRKLALNMLRTHPDKASLRRKIKKAGWDDAFLLSLFRHMR